jgi:hypothetical protein
MSLLRAEQKKEERMMKIKSRMLLAIVMLCMVGGLLGAPGIAAEGVSTNAALPRAFQNAQLGMALSEFAAVVPEAKGVSLGGRESAERTVVVPSKDRPLQRIEYRFYDDRLREIVIHYHHGEVPGGYPGLLEKLRESYGKPMSQNLQEYYTKPEAFSQKKTVWKDHATMASLTETRKMNGDKRELILAIIDLNSQRASEEDQVRRRQQELSIPIPLPGHSIQNKQAAVPYVESVPNSHANG